VIDQDQQGRFDVKQAVRSSGLTFSGESGFGQEAISLATETRPDLMLVALNAPMERPLQTIESLVTLFPSTPVIAYAKSPEADAWRSAMRAGVRDLIPTPVRPEALRDAVVKAMAIEENRRLRHHGLAPAAPAMGTIVTVFGAKGGIGKSTVAVNLAIALAREGTSTAIVDLDTGFGDVTAMLNMKASRTLGDLVKDLPNVTRDDLKQYLAHHETSGLDVLTSPPVLEWRHLKAEDIQRALELLARHYDKVVLDTGGALNEVTEAALGVATIVLWVTTSEFTSVRDSLDAMRALDALSIPRERIRIVLNAASADENVRAQTVEEVLQRPVFWQIPYDKRVRQGTHFGAPIVLSAPQAAAAESLTGLAGAIAGGRATNGHRRSGAFRWLPAVRPVKAESNP
jgi:pilus assembly protein CpaE